MFNSLVEKFEALSKREKIIVISAVILGLWSGWDSFFYQPTQKELKASLQELGSIKQQISSQQQMAAILENSPRLDPNLGNRNKLAELKAEHSRLQDLLKHDKMLVPPQLMAEALSDILSQNNHLTLIKLDTLPVSPLLESKLPQQNPIYKHGLSITFSGSYLDTLNYLKALESLPWHFIWESIDFQVTNYPIAVTTVKVYTLSFKEIWLGI